MKRVLKGGTPDVAEERDDVAVVFDIGGVIARDIWEPMLADLARHYGLDTEEVALVGRTYWKKYAILSGEPEELEQQYWDEVMDELGLPRLEADEIQSMTERYVNAFEEMLALIRVIRAFGVKVAICSNNTVYWFWRLDRACGLTELIGRDRIILSCDVGEQKSTSDRMFEAAVRALGFEGRRNRVLYFDDRAGNVKRARRFGMKSTLCNLAGRTSAGEVFVLLARASVFPP